MDLKSSLAQSLTNHTPDADQLIAIERIRQYADDLCVVIDENCPDSREKSLAKTKLEEAVMWAVKSVVLPRDEDLAETASAMWTAGIVEAKEEPEREFDPETADPKELRDYMKQFIGQKVTARRGSDIITGELADVGGWGITARVLVRQPFLGADNMAVCLRTVEPLIEAPKIEFDLEA